MGKIGKILIVVLLIAAVSVVIAIKANQSSLRIKPQERGSSTQGAQKTAAQTQSPRDKPKITTAVPRLVDLGASKCIPCKLMAPILDELKDDYKGKMEVIFIDVWEQPEEAKKYGIKIIPTQIFFDASGKELFRHEGFFSKEDILGKWKELGVSLGSNGQ